MLFISDSTSHANNRSNVFICRLASNVRHVQAVVVESGLHSSSTPPPPILQLNEIHSSNFIDAMNLCEASTVVEEDSF